MSAPLTLHRYKSRRRIWHRLVPLGWYVGFVVSAAMWLGILWLALVMLP